MSVATVEALAQLIEQSRLLSADALDEARDLIHALGDPRSAARALIERRLLTKWQAAQLLAGRHVLFLGKYKLLDQIGTDHQGPIYLADHEQMKRRVVLRTLDSGAAGNRKTIERFAVQAASDSALDHRNLVHVYDFDSANEHHFLVTEHVAGRSLADIVAADGPLEFTAVADYVGQAARGLAYLHEHDRLHGCIDPQHVVVDQHGTVKLLNAGMQGLAADADAAPLVRAEDPATDQFSLGCVGYYLLTGEEPFTSDPFREVARSLHAPPPRSPLQLRDGAPTELVNLCDKMMATDPAERFATLGESTAALARWLDEYREAHRDPSLSKRTPDESAQEEFAAEEDEAPAAAVIFPPTAVPLGSATSQDKLAVAAPLTAATSSAPRVQPHDPSARTVRSRRRKNPVPLIAVLAAGGLAIVVVIVLAMSSGGGSNDKQQARLKKTAKPNKTKTTRTTHLTETSNSVQAKVPRVKQSVTDAARSSTAGDDLPAGVGLPATNNVESRDATTQVASSSPAARGIASDLAAGVTDRPKFESPVQPKVVEPVRPSPEDGNPFDDFPERVATPLPIVPDSSDGETIDKTVFAAVDFGPLSVAAEEPVELELLGDHVAKKSGKSSQRGRYWFSLRKVGGNAAVAPQGPWQVYVHRLADKNTDGVEIARLGIAKGMLKFVWRSGATKQREANYLRNCLLRVTVRGKSRRMVLRSLKKLPPLSLDFATVPVKAKFKLPYLPDPTPTWLELTALEGDLPRAVMRPQGPSSSAKAERLIHFFEQGDPRMALHVEMSRRGEKFALSLRPFLFGTAYSRGAEISKAKIIQLKKGMAEVDKQRKYVRAQIFQITDPQFLAQQEARFKPQLKKLDNTFMQYKEALSRYEAINGAGSLHYRVFYKAGETEVILAETVSSASETPPARQSLKIDEADSAVTHTMVAAKAKLMGTLGYNPKITSVANWSKTQDVIRWEVTIGKTGRYVVELTYACPANCAGSLIGVRIGAQAVPGKVASTGSWHAFQTVRLGVLELTAGPTQVVVGVSRRAAGYAVMNVRSVKLVPVNDAAREAP